MSFENVRAFYERLANDEAFRAEIQAVESKEAGQEILTNSGYDFTPEEFEEYTANLLETNVSEDGFRDLDEKELDAVFGGVSFLLRYPRMVQMMYGVVTSTIRRIVY
ncbi:Nif11-like leader peptide family natural product precursor [Anabaena aphanizomenioides LEGE 00250]|uniref:Nif11-like leader peptide family natural product n=1 Tax=Sphaerospermopsis aphanizomenoides LEGE 00250 TaxID=2777972 RepID=A0ABR9VJ48_9CYAN|nr:Nif11-like leader peptide family natural product precursor [Sphaerospermopsis aphanizomenoides]MBE9238507.1 Nif11-like leader peptide family natural product precursor [Sphaerospermopsis aphanizomenoides LEGE 00250]